MNFLAIIICLAVDQWTDLGDKLREYDVLRPTLKKVLALLEKAGLKNPAVNLALILAVTFVLTAIIYGALNGVIFGILGFLFALTVLVYCIHGFKYRRAETVESVLSSSLDQTFSIIFWFALLGPMGALFYRVTQVLTLFSDQAELSGRAQVVQAVMDWVPSRLLALCFAVVGNFTAVIKVWLNAVISDLRMNQAILFDCVQAAFSKEKSEGDVDQKAYAVNLIDRSLIVWLVVLAVMVLIYL